MQLLILSVVGRAEDVFYNFSGKNILYRRNQYKRRVQYKVFRTVENGFFLIMNFC
jgi:hypothetical protein